MNYTEKEYPFSFEIAGPCAFFGRGDTGASPISYPAPTRSALIGMASCLAMGFDAYFLPLWVEVCRPLSYHKYVQNYNGPLRKSNGPFQLMMTVLEDVDYRVHGVIRGYAPPTSQRNPMHELQEVFERRLKRGLFARTPTLGLREFVPSYFGPLRPDTAPDPAVNLVIPSMLDTMFDRPTRGKLSPTFRQDVAIEKGVLRFAE